jgi:ribosomal protein L37AE/L43A
MNKDLLYQKVMHDPMTCPFCGSDNVGGSDLIRSEQMKGLDLPPGHFYMSYLCGVKWCGGQWSVLVKLEKVLDIAEGADE